ncbi:hypothetical protein [Mycolicibacter icosiumassiliensis]|uniref:hypothetical protein n=1 Tax=Mycolicibacter icosiumassiliensis TaxID=1792835 RepID=UPI000AB48915|nr:hypothetical protein [Mycolicibacter icosiumassiliensis]
MTKVRPDLGEVQESLLIPLYGRACDAAKRRPMLGDVRARELVDTLDYDFSRFRGGSHRVRCYALRSSMLRELSAWGLQLLDSRTMATPQPELAPALPVRYRYGMPVLAKILPGLVNTYRFNLFRLGDAA